MSLIDLMKARYSVRQYKSTPVEEEKLMAVLEAGRVAPTAANRQPQRIYVVRTPEALGKLAKAANIHNPPLALIVCADKSEAWVRPIDQKDSCDNTRSRVAARHRAGTGQPVDLHVRPGDCPQRVCAAGKHRPGQHPGAGLRRLRAGLPRPPRHRTQGPGGNGAFLLNDARGLRPLGSKSSDLAPAPTYGRSAPCPGLLSRVEKVGKDTPGTSWFLDLRHKGEDPLGFPRLSALAVLVARTETFKHPRGQPCRATD